MGTVAELNRTLEQEILALLRGASLECPACGEFVMHVEGAIVCSMCRSSLEKEGAGEAELQLTMQAG